MKFIQDIEMQWKNEPRFLAGFLFYTVVLVLVPSICLRPEPDLILFHGKLRSGIACIKISK